jgi:hypothetical protein
VCDQETPKREAKGPFWTISACEWMKAKQNTTDELSRTKKIDVTFQALTAADMNMRAFWDIAPYSVLE